MRLPRFLAPSILTALAVVGSFLWLRQEVTTRVYRDRLEVLSQEYASLADRYNEAVRQTAVTELEVTGDSLFVLIRTMDGALRRIPTPYDPSQEIYVDYVVGDSRIWIRRVFDSSTPPGRALVIDPLWETVDWKTGPVRYGKAVYRSLEPGIWSIQVSGNGALSLERVSESRAGQLQAAPPVLSYEEIQLALEADPGAVTFGDIWSICTDFFTSKKEHP